MESLLEWARSKIEFSSNPEQIKEISNSSHKQTFKLYNATTNKTYYVKENFNTALKEGELIEYLSIVSEHVAPIINKTTVPNRILSLEYGTPLIDILKNKIHYKPILNALLSYVTLQKHANNNTLAKLGCETLQLEDILPKFIYKLLLIQSTDPQNIENSFAILRNTSIIHSYLGELLDLNIPLTLAQNDFNITHVRWLNNIKFIKFSDTIITCPLFSACSFILYLQEHFKSHLEKDVIPMILTNYVLQFESLFNISRHDINKGLRIANFLYPIYYIATIPDHKLEEALTKNSPCANKIKITLYNMTKLLLQRREELWN